MGNAQQFGKGRTIRLYTVDGQSSRIIGKIVPRGYEHVYASTFSPDHTRRKDGNRLGVNLAVIVYCHQHGVDKFFINDAKGALPMSRGMRQGYITDYATLKEYGVTNPGNRWGTIINLPDSFWEKLNLRGLPYIKDEDFVPVYADQASWEVAA